MTPEERGICEEVHAGLVSRERSNFNYLFLEPVDTSYFPTYLSVVQRPMDLRTLKENLDAGEYATKAAFYDDAQRIFDNATLFNKDRADSIWVVDLAKRMTKALDRVRKKAEAKAARAAAAAGAGGGSRGESGDPKSKEKDKGGGREGERSGGKEGGTKKKKLSIKLKRSTSGAPAGDAASVASSADEVPPRPPGKKVKSKLKLKVSSSSSSGGGAAGGSGSSRASTPDPTAGATEISAVPMTAARRAGCYKVLASLKRRQPANCRWFHRPVTDPAIVKDYKEKIRHPIDLSTMASKLDKKQYASLGDFVLDLRRIASNCLQYNTTVNDSYRAVAVEFLALSEDLCKFFIAKEELPKVVYPPILYCWRDAVQAIDELIELINPDDQLQTAWYFLQPVSFFCGGDFPEGYLDKVKKPIDYGTIVQHLITGRYRSVGAFVADCRSVVQNCRAFYAGNADTAPMLEKADRLYASMEKSLGPLFLFDQSEKGARARERAAARSLVIPRPEQALLRDVMRALRASTYTDKSAKITEQVTVLFEKPVDTTVFKDYRSFVENPMDLETIDKKIEKGSYATPEDFEHDVNLIFKNCEWYHGPKKNFGMVNLGKQASKIFRKLFAEKMSGGSQAKRPSLSTSTNKVMGGKGAGKIGGKKRPMSPSKEEKATKRVSIKGPQRGASKMLAGSAKAPKPPKVAKPSAPARVEPASNLPVPLHVAIASIKESYPGRRQIKDLEGWEGQCMKIMKQLRKHPWVSAERPKYIFHVPVHIIFPEIRDSYAAKIKHPMDLTTAEAKLLQGAYANAEEFVSDIALVFSNAIEFNKEGHDVGEAMSCAYYEASTHLLKYVRWLSLEFLQSFLVDDSAKKKSSVVESGAASHWKLTVQNRQMARKEMENIVFKELLDKTQPGDHYSSLEKECEKLLMSLRSNSCAKHMYYFMLMSSLPPDYTSFISNPMAWDKCESNLKMRKYNTTGEIVEDLRLIFSNALKYNEGARQVSEVSQMAYDSASYMSGKLEAAIDKMLLSVGDRIGRERIDLITSQRELEVKEREEEEQKRLQWEKEHPGSLQVKEKFKLLDRKVNRKRMTDFEFPFYDEADDHLDLHPDSLQHAKAAYEKQREARAKSKEIALKVAQHVFRQLDARAAARAIDLQNAKRLAKEREEARAKEVAIAKAKAEADAAKAPKIQRGACVLSVLNDGNRKQIKMSLQRPKKKKRALISF